MWKARISKLDSYSIWILEAGNHKLLTSIYSASLEVTTKVSHSITLFAASGGKSEEIATYLLRVHAVSDLVGLAAIWRGWLDLICFGGGSTDLIGGVEWILKLWSSWSASSIPN